MTLSMGVAMNHVAAVTMPLVGGIVWKYLGLSMDIPYRLRGRCRKYFGGDESS